MEQSLNTQSTGRIYLNKITFSLTVRRLTAQDSGNYSFLSEAKGRQRDTVMITLYVHEPITTPVLTANTTSHAFNGSCTVFLRCISDGKVNYNWTMRARTHRGSSTQHYTIRPQDGETTFTCTIWNVVSERSASTTVTCSNDTSDQQKPVPSPSSLVPFFVWLIIGISVIVVLVLSLLYYTKSKDVCCNRLTQTPPASQDENQQPVYSSLLYGEGSIYETMRGREDAAGNAVVDTKFLHQ
ncbi:CD48 antigen-like [Seriola dumerili]|uniref:CD48 antigen-like n=1 Tax=Seriola dumerili TaxID=41447 RepID=UPI000BBE5936|nr:CD48 antigen-like [Seriola dumerili]